LAIDLFYHRHCDTGRDTPLSSGRFIRHHLHSHSGYKKPDEFEVIPYCKKRPYKRYTFSDRRAMYLCRPAFYKLNFALALNKKNREGKQQLIWKSKVGL